MLRGASESSSRGVVIRRLGLSIASIGLSWACQAGSECAQECPDDLVCVEAQCRAPCNRLEDCDAGEYCNQGVCFDAVCGNGRVEGAEQCDLREENSDNAGCTASCRLATCGDGLVFVGEEDCDDDDDDTDECARCKQARCGDGFVRADRETCDDGNTLPDDGCSDSCAIESGFCCIDGIGCVTAGTPNADNTCLVCNPALSDTTWSGDTGAQCNDGDICVDDLDCDKRQCECVDAECTQGRCSAAPCTCQYNIEGDATCDGDINAGLNPLGGCPDPDCSGSGSGSRYYHGVADLSDDGEDNPLCYRVEDPPGRCDGAGACVRDDALCEAAARGDPDPLRPPCRKPVVDNTTCQGTIGPSYTVVSRFQDPYGDCEGTCNGLGQCHAQAGEFCDGDVDCESGLACVDNACCGGGACLAKGSACADNAACASGLCVDDRCCSTACGECERCNVSASEGDCVAVNEAEGRGCLGDPCTHCLGGSCVPRGDGDGTECTATCQVCTGSPRACAGATAPDGANCEGDDTFCCAGTCVNPAGTPSELGGACGLGDCAGGTWECDGTSPRCTRLGQSCGMCLGDTRYEGTCSYDYGTTCDASPVEQCPVCTFCFNSPTLFECRARGVNLADTVEPNTCGGDYACDGAGSCLLKAGVYCDTDGECISGECLFNTCT